jgi:hypothetical protein
MRRLILWRVVDSGLCSRDDLRRTWTYLDLMEAISYLNIKSDLEEIINADIERTINSSGLQS